MIMSTLASFLLLIWQVLGIIVGIGAVISAVIFFVIFIAALIKIGWQKLHETHA